MKLYTRKDFMGLPKGTIYSRVDKSRDDQLCHGLYCKVSNKEQMGNGDFVEQDLISEAGNPLMPDVDNGEDNVNYQMHLRDSFKTFRTDLNCAGRDGMFDEEDLFVVWDAQDIKKLAEYLLSRIMRFGVTFTIEEKI